MPLQHHHDSKVRVTCVGQFLCTSILSQAESLVHDSSASRVALIFPIWSESFVDSTKIGA